jgi:PAS domain S-box-containing protein
LSVAPEYSPEFAAAPHAAQAELRAARAQIEALRAELSLRNAALDASTAHFLIVDARQRHQPILYVNRTCAIQHGYESPDALLGQSAFVLLGEYVRHDEWESARAQLRAGRAVRLESEIARRDGTKFLAGFSITPLHDAGGAITHYVTIGADITAKRENERERERMALELRLAQKLEAVGRLAAGLAHEINTPIQYVCDSVHFLRSAFGDLSSLFDLYRTSLRQLHEVCGDRQAIEMLAAQERRADLDFLAEEVPKAFERTLEGADRVAALVRAMKEFAYPDAAEHVPADLNHALTTTLTVARGEYKHAARVVTTFGELPPVVCNVGELNQVFLNLIVNAAHAIADAGKDAATGLIELATQARDGWVCIEIGDNGCGIAADALDRIFDPFFTTKEVGRGTGQGLAIARSIVVDKHGGRIEVASTPGTGTRFTVLLPACSTRAEKP